MRGEENDERERESTSHKEIIMTEDKMGVEWGKEREEHSGIEKEVEETTKGRKDWFNSPSRKGEGGT